MEDSTHLEDDICNNNNNESSRSPRVKFSRELGTINEYEDSCGLDKLKVVATRLKLSTHRPSYVEWRANIQQFHLKKRTLIENGISSKTEEERRERIQQAIEWLRAELLDMKSQDHTLAMQLMQLRTQIQEVKLRRISEEHKDLIEDKRYSLTEEMDNERWGLCDLPIVNVDDDAFGDPLKDIGVTKMNLSTRRFSIL